MIACRLFARAAPRSRKALLPAEAFLRAKKTIGKLHSGNSDVQAGINIVLKAVEAPVRQIAENSGYEGSIVVNKILQSILYRRISQ